jgi:hypothetical protein
VTLTRVVLIGISTIFVMPRAHEANVCHGSSRLSERRTEIGDHALTVDQLARSILPVAHPAHIFGRIRCVLVITADGHTDATDADVSRFLFAATRRAIFDPIAQNERSFKTVIGHLADQLASFTWQH